MARAILPRELTEDLAYLMGFILADGYLKDENKLLSTNRYPEYSICLYDNSKEFLEYAQNLFKKLFNVKANLYFAKDKKGSWYVLRCASKPVHRFFSAVLKIQQGNKTGKIDVPMLIKKSSMNLKKAFIAGFFDGEVGIGISIKNPWLEINQLSIPGDKPAHILLWCQKELKEMNIILHGPTLMHHGSWRLRTASKKVIDKFYETIPLRHMDKIKACEEIKRFSYANQNRYRSALSAEYKK